MKRTIIVLASLLTVAACTDRPTPSAPEAEAPPTNSAEIDAALDLTSSDALEAIVTFDAAATTSAAVTDAVLATGAGVVTFKHLPMVAALATGPQLEEIAAIDGVQGVWANSQLDWHLAESIETIGADRVWSELGYTGKGMGVAILDSGIDGLYHPDVAYPSRTVQNIKYMASSQDLYADLGDPEGPKVGLELFLEDVANSETSIGHGTHVAGIAAGNGSASSGGIYKGVAPEADIVGIGAGDVLFIFWIIAGFDYILEHQDTYNIKVVNNSWGSNGFAFNPNHPINIATKEAADAGIAVVFSAGNCGTEEDADCADAGQHQINPYSAAPWVISVAAGCKTVQDPTSSKDHCADVTGQGRTEILADFSSRGIPGDDLHHPDITGPGVHIVSARASTGTVMNGLDSNHDARICNISLQHEAFYTCASGTSMSAPHVTGVIALMQEAAGGSLSPAQIYDIIEKTATPIAGFELWEVGQGYLDAFEAVRRAGKKGNGGGK